MSKKDMKAIDEKKNNITRFMKQDTQHDKVTLVDNKWIKGPISIRDSVFNTKKSHKRTNSNISDLNAINEDEEFKEVNERNKKIDKGEFDQISSARFSSQKLLESKLVDNYKIDDQNKNDKTSYTNVMNDKTGNMLDGQLKFSDSVIMKPITIADKIAKKGNMRSNSLVPDPSNVVQAGYSNFKIQRRKSNITAGR